MNDLIGSRSYRPGDWYAVLGPDLTLLLPPSERSRVAALWELVDGGADLEEVLDALIASGLRSLPAFALVGGGPDATRVVLRGPARALVAAGDDRAELAGSDAASWVDRTFAGVTALALLTDVESGPDGPDGPAGPDLPAGPGLVRAGRLDQPAVTSSGAAPAAAAAAEERTHTAPNPLPDLPPVPPPPGGGPSPMPPTPPVGVPVAVPATAPVAGPVAWSPEEGRDLDHDGHTHQPGYDPDSFVRQQPGIPGQQPAPSITRPVARLNVSHGEVVEVDRAVLVGRAPEARRFSATEQPRLLTVPSPHQEISSTHLEIRPGSGADHGSAVATDLGSTNGTVLVQPGLPPEPLQAGIPVQLLPGAVLDLGDGVTIQVTNP